jgi:DNA-binding NarL/FixJ family response regulator
VTVRVLLADDQALVRAGFRMILEAQDDLEVVGEAADGEQALVLAAQSRPDVVLMDIRMPRLDGLEATRRLARDQPSARVLVLTTFDLDDYVYDALQAGASGFLLKDVGRDELVHAVRVVAGR